jgi:hypothetical protein
MQSQRWLTGELAMLRSSREREDPLRRGAGAQAFDIGRDQESAKRKRPHARPKEHSSSLMLLAHFSEVAIPVGRGHSAIHHKVAPVMLGIGE